MKKLDYETKWIELKNSIFIMLGDCQNAIHKMKNEPFNPQQLNNFDRLRELEELKCSYEILMRIFYKMMEMEQ